MLKVEIAATPHAHEKGLMFRKQLSFDNGMLFVFSRSQKLSFWGRNTYIPLDIAFIDDNHRISKIAHITPHNVKSVSSENLCSIAIETNIGYFHQNNIKVGHKIEINKLNDKIGVVTFHRESDD